MIGLDMSLIPVAEAGVVQRCSPQMVAFASLLARPAVEVTAMVERELERNPALERAEVEGCWICGRRGCRRCGYSRVSTSVGTPTETVPYRTSPRDQLFSDAAELADPVDRPLLRLLVDSLDERGLLRAPDRRAIPASDHQIDRVIAVLRQAGPPGIAAPDAVAGLILQLDASHDAHAEVVRTVLTQHLERIADGDSDAVAATLKITSHELADALDWMRATLRPFPISLEPNDPPLAPPDLAVFEHPTRAGHFIVEVIERRYLGLRVDDAFRRLAVTCAEAAEHVHAATRLIDRLEQRWATLRQVTALAVSAQRTWITGRGDLVDLTRAEVARSLRYHESTVSRCVAGRRLMLPDGRTIPFAELFQTGAAAKRALRDLVAHETHPLSDSVLSAELRRLGYEVARRTVAKYRAELGIARATSQHGVRTLASRH